MNLKIDKKTSTAYSNVIIVVQSRQLEGTREVNIGMKAAQREIEGGRGIFFSLKKSVPLVSPSYCTRTIS